jgi:hypothetical protein
MIKVKEKVESKDATGDNSTLFFKPYMNKNFLLSHLFFSKFEAWLALLFYLLKDYSPPTHQFIIIRITCTYPSRLEFPRQSDERTFLL